MSTLADSPDSHASVSRNAIVFLPRRRLKAFVSRDAEQLANRHDAIVAKHYVTRATHPIG
jgi:hypothetical protein